jgi:hypothetical protein
MCSVRRAASLSCSLFILISSSIFNCAAASAAFTWASILAFSVIWTKKLETDHTASTGMPTNPKKLRKIIVVKFSAYGTDCSKKSLWHTKIYILAKKMILYFELSDMKKNSSSKEDF